jgi:OmpA-OmpF porin, OOP family
MKRFAVALVAVVGMSTTAQAGVEIGGTAGLHVFSDTNGLGKQTGLNQASSAMFGARISIPFGSMLGVELEAGLVPTESAGGNTVFDIYDGVARVNLIAQFRAADMSNSFVPFIVVGGGAMRVLDSKNIDPTLFHEDTDGEGHVGIGIKYRAGGGWGVRADGRVIIVPSNTDGYTQDFEILATLYREFGRKKAAKVVETPKTADADADGVDDATDKCKDEAEDKDDFQDDDGCPDKDNDADGVPDEADKCKGEAEDKDNFEADDGCPETDNDKDGVLDASDKCADKAETANGFEDEDGCPDDLPEELTKIVGPIVGVSFKANSADLAAASNKSLDAVAAVLAKYPTVKVEIGAHSDDQALKAGGKFADNDALTAAQAEAVKAYLVKKGATEGQIVVKGYGSAKPMQDPAGLKGAKLAAARKINRRVELTLVVPEAAGGAAPPVETPAPEAPKAEEPKKE